MSYFIQELEKIAFLMYFLPRRNLCVLEFFGCDSNNAAYLVQGLEKIACQIDQPPRNPKILWAAESKKELNAPRAWVEFCKHE